jgi:ketosteroid isomerase-like protein
MVSDLERRLDLIESELALHRLAAEYCHGADKRDLDRFLQVWTQDASWILSDEVSLKGPDAIASVVQRQWDAFAAYVHWTTNHVVRVEGDRARGEVDVAVAVQLHSGRWLQSGGTYIDEYVRVDGR